MAALCTSASSAPLWCRRKISYANRPSFAIWPTASLGCPFLILLSFQFPQPQPLVTLHASELLFAFVGRIMGYPPCALCCMSRSSKSHETERGSRQLYNAIVPNSYTR
jgi:hypothetical protein